MKNINFIDLFAGASGMSEGFVKAGFNPISHIEMDEQACYTIKTRSAYHYLKNKGKLNIYYDYLNGKINREALYNSVPKNIINSVLNIEITDDSINQIFEHIDKLKKNRPIDLIIGGPPCQAYSLIGRHQKEIEKDPRNKLYIQYGRFLKKYQPKAFVFENVPGIISANKGKHFKNLKAYFKRLGYKVYYDTLNATNYGVLQARKRIIIVGWKKENDFGFPKIEKINNNFSVNDVLYDLPKLKPGDSLKIAKYNSDVNEYLARFELRNGIDFTTQHITRSHNERDLKIYAYAIKIWNKNNIRLKYPDLPEELRTHNNLKSFVDRFKVVNGNGYSHTVVAHIAKDGHYYIHPDIKQCRSISVREAARIQSFPDDFFFEGSRTAAFKQIGNAVPPLMSFAIAKEIKKLLSL